MQGNLIESMWSLKFIQLFLSLNTSASLSKVALSFFEMQAQVLFNLK